MLPEHDETLQPSAEVSAEAESPAEEPETPPEAASSPVEAAVAASEPEPAAEAAAEPAGEPTEEAAAEKAEESAEAMGELIDQYAEHQRPLEGEVIEGNVVAMTDLGVVVDIGGKFEGLVPAQEVMEFEGTDLFVPGNTIPVQPLDQHKDGYRLLSFLRARQKRAWENIEKSHRGHVPLTGKVVDRVKGGLVVDLGVRAFMPASQVDLRPPKDLAEWVGQEITCRVLKMNRKRGNVVVSRRILMEEELQAVRAHLLESITEGAVVKGKIKNLTDYGVFVDLGGMDGLLHVTDLTWGRVAHPSELVSPGDEIEVKVLKFDREKMRVSLGRKQLAPDPWKGIDKRYSAGARIHGRVVGVTDYGAFIELEPGVEGLVHVSEMTWSKRLKHPSKIVTIGDEVEVEVLDVKSDQRRISLGLKQTMPDPWETLALKYPVGTVVAGRVRNLTDFGAFVEVEEGVDGLIHVSDISWNHRVSHPSEVVKKGETLEAKVLKIDMTNRRLSLGLKQMDTSWNTWCEKHKVNDVVRGRVSRSTNFGVFVELAEGIEGLCHISEVEGRRGKNKEKQSGEKPATSLEIGQEYDFKIIRLDPEQHRIGLSYRGAQKAAERRDMEHYRSSKSSATATIGDMILSKRGIS